MRERCGVWERLIWERLRSTNEACAIATITDRHEVVISYENLLLFGCLDHW
jgi:hypothetical protein